MTFLAKGGQASDGHQAFIPTHFIRREDDHVVQFAMTSGWELDLVTEIDECTIDERPPKLLSITSTTTIQQYLCVLNEHVALWKWTEQLMEHVVVILAKV